MPEKTEMNTLEGVECDFGVVTAREMKNIYEWAKNPVENVELLADFFAKVVKKGVDGDVGVADTYLDLPANTFIKLNNTVVMLFFASMKA